MKYNLNTLRPYEFEEMCQSIVQSIIGPGVKIYGMGKDGAREAVFKGRAAYPSEKENWDGDWIIQVKYHDVNHIGLLNARKEIINDLRGELSIITKKYKIPCDNYLLFTNVSLSPVFEKGTKDKIDNEIIPNYINKIKNIQVIGCEEISRFLDNNPAIRKTYSSFLLTSDLIARVLGLVDNKPTSIDEIIKLYCVGCFYDDESAVLDDAGDGDEKPIELQKVFVDLSVQATELDFDLDVKQEIPKWLKTCVSDKNRTSAMSYLLDDMVESIVLTGGPGEGKSTLGQYLAQLHRSFLIGKLDEIIEIRGYFETCVPRIPFRILLKDYAQWISTNSPKENIYEYLCDDITSKSGQNITLDELSSILRTNPTLLILDGLDEVPEKGLRNRVITNITSFINQIREVFNNDLRVVASTRPYGYSEEFDPKKFLHLKLEKLSKEKALEYTEKWLEIRARNEREKNRIFNVLRDCMDDKVIGVLTKTPLQVSILLVIIRATGRPPKQREELFDEYMDTIYQREVKKGSDLLRTDKDLITGLHKKLGYFLHKRAEEDKTAALIDLPEFEILVKSYIEERKPIYNQEEIKTVTDQIIEEASQRLVLIESPQDEKIGFGLTIIREFFAATYLVDSSKKTDHLMERFSNLVQNPHWRNTALFFAGRVGRLREGEAPLMIDICCEIDTKDIDFYLKRGAEFTLAMAEDKVFRNQCSEIAAINYGLTYLERGYFKDTEKIDQQLQSISDEYKLKIVKPWLVNKLRTVITSELPKYVCFYSKLFSLDEFLENVLLKISNSSNKSVLIMILENTIEYDYIEKWVIGVFEKLVKLESYKENIVHRMKIKTISMLKLFNFEITPELLHILLTYILENSERNKSEDLLKYTDMIKFEWSKSKENKNLLILLAIFNILNIDLLESKHSFRKQFDHYPFYEYPLVLLPGAVDDFLEKDFVEFFISTFNDQHISDIVNTTFRFYDFLNNLNDIKKFENLVAHKSSLSEMPYVLIRGILQMLGSNLISNKNKELELYQELVLILSKFKTLNILSKVNQEFNYILHRYKEKNDEFLQILELWIKTDFNKYVEQKLNKELKKDILSWLKKNELNRDFLRLIIRGFTRISDNIEYVMNLGLAISENIIDNGGTIIYLDYMFSYIIYQREGPIQLDNAKLGKVFNFFIQNYETQENGRELHLFALIIACLSSGILTEEHLDKIHKIYVKEDKKVMLNIGRLLKNSEILLEHLKLFLKGSNDSVKKIVYLLLNSIQDSFSELDINRILGIYYSEELLNLIEKDSGKFKMYYINSLGRTTINWKKNRTRIIKMMQDEDSETIDRWNSLILNSKYIDNNEFLKFLISILKSDETFSKNISSALERLNNEISTFIESTVI